jgi:hypothetical protein
MKAYRRILNFGIILGSRSNRLYYRGKNIEHALDGGLGRPILIKREIPNFLLDIDPLSFSNFTNITDFVSTPTGPYLELGCKY